MDRLAEAGFGWHESRIWVTRVETSPSRNRQTPSSVSTRVRRFSTCLAIQHRHMSKLRPLRENHPTFKPFVLGGTHIRDLPSAGDHAPDRLIISMPWSFNDEPERKYPVVYLCDGYWDFPLMWAMYSHLLFDKVVPEYTLVGLAYGGEKPDVDALRLKDLAPPDAKSVEQGTDYLSRLENSIIPFIEDEYAGDPTFRCIAGASIGGAFALSALFRKPGLFQAAIALCPRADAHGRQLHKDEDVFFRAGRTLGSTLLGRRKELPARIFLAAGGEDDPRITGAIEEFNEILDARHYRFLEKQYRVIDGEKHGALKPEGFNRGLRHVFAELAKT